MDGLSRVAGVGPTVQLDGETLTVRGRTLRHYAELEAEIIRLRGDPFDIIRNLREELFRFDDELVEKLFNQIDMKWRIVRIEEIHEWLSTLRGRFFSIWQAIRHNGAKHTFDWTAETLSHSPAEWAQVERAVNQASGLDEVAALDWINRTVDKNEMENEWRILFKKLAKKPYYMHPQQVLDLTMDQLVTLSSEDDEIRLNPQGFTDRKMKWYVANRKEKISQAAKNLMKGKPWYAE